MAGSLGLWLVIDIVKIEFFTSRDYLGWDYVIPHSDKDNLYIYRNVNSR